MRWPYALALSVCVVVLIGYYAWSRLWSSATSPRALARKALSAATPEERARAAAELAMLRDAEVVPQMRRLAQESEDADVLVVAINKLSYANDTDSLSVFYGALDHSELRVREAAINGVIKFRCGPLPENMIFRANDPEEKRVQVTRRLRELREKARKAEEDERARRSLSQ